jgi:cytoskeletal protein CcmA (bactofilin family)
MVALILTPIVAEVVTTDLYIVGREEVVGEDVYVATQSASVEGTIEGDLTIVGGDLTISGTVTGSVNALSAATVTVTESGRVDGSLRSVGRQVVIAGIVAGDVATTAITTTVGGGASVQRDLIVFGGRLSVRGEVGRDIRGRVFDVTVDGSAGNDIDMTVSRLSIGADAVIGGDVLYRSSGEAAIADGATIIGQVVALPSSPNFIYGIILTLANIVSLLAFLVIGFVAIWLFRATSQRAVVVAIRRPVRVLLTGVVATVAAPILVVLFAVTLVGLPVALALAVLIVLGLVVGPVPIVAAAGDRILRSRGGLFGAFLLGAVVWRLGIWFIPWVGGFIFMLGLVWGVGAWIVGAWDQRRAGEGVELLPPAMRLEDDLDDFEFPLPPVPRATPPPVETAAVPQTPTEETFSEPGEPAPAEPESDLASRVASITDDVVVPGADRPAIVDAGREDEEARPAGTDDWGLPG